MGRPALSVLATVLCVQANPALPPALTASALAHLLSRYEVGPRQFRTSGSENSVRGYVLADLQDAFERDLSRGVTPVTAWPISLRVQPGSGHACRNLPPAVIGPRDEHRRPLAAGPVPLWVAAPATLDEAVQLHLVLDEPGCLADRGGRAR